MHDSSPHHTPTSAWDSPRSSQQQHSQAHHPQAYQQPRSQDWNGNSGYYSDHPPHAQPAAAPVTAHHVDSAEIAADMMSLARHNRVDELVSMLGRNRQGPSTIGIDERDKFGNTVLTTACQNGLKRMAKLALRHGADINLKNFTSGNTPLHFCFKYGYGDTLGAYLISKGADDSIRNHAGQTCREVAPNVHVTNSHAHAQHTQHAQAPAAQVQYSY